MSHVADPEPFARAAWFRKMFRKMSSLWNQGEAYLYEHELRTLAVSPLSSWLMGLFEPATPSSQAQGTWRLLHYALPQITLPGVKAIRLLNPCMHEHTFFFFSLLPSLRAVTSLRPANRLWWCYMCWHESLRALRQDEQVAQAERMCYHCGNHLPWTSVVFIFSFCTPRTL